MEFININRLTKVPNGKVFPYEDLVKLSPVTLASSLTIVENEENLQKLKAYADDGCLLIPIRRQPNAKTTATNNGKSDFPKRVLLEMTSKCNMLCRMCPQNDLERPRMHMDKNLYMKCLDELDEHGVEGLWLYHLGESLLHPDFREIVDYLGTKTNLGVIWFSTNGHLMNEDNSSFILESKIDFINYSLHAMSASVYNQVSQKGNYEEVRNNIDTLIKKKKDLRKSKPFIHLQMINQECTKSEIDQFLQSYYDKVEIVSVNLLEYGGLANNEYGFVSRKRQPLLSCNRISRSDCFICSNGAVTPCDAAYNGEIYLGNINEKSLYEIWNGPERKHYLELNNEGRMADVPICQSCTDYDL